MARDLPQIRSAQTSKAVEDVFSLFDGSMQVPTTPFLLKNGERRSLRDYPGRPVVVTFWATWCGPCAREMPELDDMAADLPEVAFAPLALDRHESIRKIENYYRRHQIRSLLPAVDSGQSLARAFGVPGTPTSLVIDGGGGVRASCVGNVNWRHPDIRAFVLSLA